MANYLIQGESLTAIADAIRTKTGGTNALTLDQMASDLNAIADRTESDLTASGVTVTVPAGNYKTQATKSVSDANLVAENIAEGVSIFGVTGTHSGGNSGTAETWTLTLEDGSTVTKEVYVE